MAYLSSAHEPFLYQNFKNIGKTLKSRFASNFSLASPPPQIRETARLYLFIPFTAIKSDQMQHNDKRQYTTAEGQRGTYGNRYMTYTTDFEQVEMFAVQ